MRKEVDDQRTVKTEIDSGIALQENEREKIKQELKEIKQKMGEVMLVKFFIAPKFLFKILNFTTKNNRQKKLATD